MPNILNGKGVVDFGGGASGDAVYMNDSADNLAAYRKLFHLHALSPTGMDMEMYMYKQLLPSIQPTGGLVPWPIIPAMWRHLMGTFFQLPVTHQVMIPIGT